MRRMCFMCCRCVCVCVHVLEAVSNKLYMRLMRLSGEGDRVGNF